MTAVQVTDVEALHRRSLRVPMAAQLLSGAGLAAGVTVGALLAEHMLGSTSLSGLPAGLLTLGSAGAALLIGQISQRSGRRPGLAAGYLAGAQSWHQRPDRSAGQCPGPAQRRERLPVLLLGQLASRD